MNEIDDADKASLDDLPSSSEGFQSTHYLRRDIDPKFH